MPCLDHQRFERATGKPSFDCPTFEPLDVSQWCENCKREYPQSTLNEADGG
jgi:hypothetical protein